MNYIAGIMMVVMVVALGFVYFKYIKQSSVKHRDVEPQTAQDLWVYLKYVMVFFL